MLHDTATTGKVSPQYTSELQKRGRPKAAPPNRHDMSRIQASELYSRRVSPM